MCGAVYYKLTAITTKIIIEKPQRHKTEKKTQIQSTEQVIEKWRVHVQRMRQQQQV